MSFNCFRFPAITSDLWGNRRLIKDANAGLITSAYNGFNELDK